MSFASRTTSDAKARARPEPSSPAIRCCRCIGHSRRNVFRGGSGRAQERVAPLVSSAPRFANPRPVLPIQPAGMFGIPGQALMIRPIRFPRIAGERRSLRYPLPSRTLVAARNAGASWASANCISGNGAEEALAVVAAMRDLVGGRVPGAERRSLGEYGTAEKTTHRRLDLEEQDVSPPGSKGEGPVRATPMQRRRAERTRPPTPPRTTQETSHSSSSGAVRG